MPVTEPPGAFNLVRWLTPTALRDDADAGGPGRSAWIGPVLLLGAVFLARVVYLAFFSPYDLTEDEAFYWEWSRHPDWSYTTKGPGIAWAIWLSVRIFGESVFGVRMVAVTAGLVAGLAVLGLARDVTRGAPESMARRALWVTASLACLMPSLQVMGLLSTIDGPYIACWAVAAWAGFRALALGSKGAWVMLGAALGVGVLFKYTILLLIPGVLLFAWRWRTRPRGEGGVSVRAGPGWRRWACAGAALAMLGLAPIMVWNARHDWATVRHLLGHLGITASRVTATGEAVDSGEVAVTDDTAQRGWTYTPRHTLELIGTQTAAVGPAIGLMAWGWWSVWRAGRRARRSAATPGFALHEDAMAASYLLHVAAPILLFHLAISCVSSVEGNWPVAGYLTLLPLAGALVAARARRGAGTPGRPGVRPAFALWHASIIVGVVSGVGMLRLDWVRDGLGRVAPEAAERATFFRRVLGARELAAHVDELRRDLEARTGRTPFILAEHYGRASQLAFELPDRPIVFVAQSRLGGRAVQQDYWPQYSLDRPDLLGRDAVIVGDVSPAPVWERAFERVEPLGRLRGETRPGREGFIGYGYRGLPRPARMAH